MPLPAQCCRSEQADDKTACSPDLSLRGGAADVAISGRQLRFRRECLVIRPYSARFPRRVAPRNDKLGSLAPMNLCRDHCRPAWRSLSAATDAIGVYHFNGGLYWLQVLRRERHAAPLQGVCGRQSAAAFPSAIRYDYAKRTAGRPSSALFTASILPGPPAYCRYRGRNAHAARRLSPSGPSGRPCRGAARRGPCRPRRHPAPRRGWHSAS